MAKKIKVSDIVFMNVVTLLGVRWFATAAQYGAASIILWILAALLFFVPMSFILAEFSSVFPESKGGIVEWVKEIFGEETAFYTSWFCLITNIFYYPTILTFAAISIAYIFFPNIAENKLYVTSFVIFFYWFVTYFNVKGIKVIAFVAKLTGLFGNILPIVTIILLAIVSAFILKNPIPTDYSFQSWIPKFNSGNLLFLVTLSYALAGGEITSAFVTDLENPKKDFPKATLISALVIALCYIFGTVAITLLLSPEEIGAASGIFAVIIKATGNIGMPWIGTILCFLIALTAIASLLIWTVGIIKMFTEGNDPKYVPEFLRKENKYDVPANALIVQGIVVTCIVLLTSFMKSVENIYMVLVIMATVTQFLIYLIVLLAYFKLKFSIQKQGRMSGIFEIPGKKPGAFIAFLVATISTVITLLIPIFSPGDNNIFIYELEIIGGPILFTFVAWLIIKRGNKRANSS